MHRALCRFLLYQVMEENKEERREKEETKRQRFVYLHGTVKRSFSSLVKRALASAAFVFLRG